MKELRDVLPTQTDEEGRRIFGNPERGCPYCNTVEVKVGTDDRSVWYHPSVMCCSTRVFQQQEWRQSELRDLNRALTDHEEHIADLWNAAQNASGYAVAEANAKAERAQQSLAGFTAGQAQRRNELNEELGDIYKRMRELELARR